MTGLDRLLLERRIDAVLAPWAGQTGPGASIGVVREGALELHRSAGLANVEHAVPIGPATRFRIASVSKQFTTTAVLLLAQDGKLALDDHARDHLPELDLDGRVTLSHLMHNTSGIRDMLEIMRHGGVDLGMPVSQPALLDGIARQRRLNFEPGHRFLYSNSNFLLLGLIVERVSGQPLDAVLEERIFAPLGMSRTRMTPDVHRVVPGLATGYRPVEPGWARAPHAFPLHGEGGLVSCVEDLALWDRNLDTGRVGGEWLGSALSQQTPFAGGGTNRYARGQVVREYRGLRTISHGGLWPGYRTEFLRVPERRTTVIAIANASNIDPNLLAHRVLDALLEGDGGVHAVPPWPERPALRALAGRWINPARPATLDVSVPEVGPPTLATFGLVFATEPWPRGGLATARANTVLAVRATGENELEVEEDAGTVERWHRVKPGAAVPDGLAGHYYNEDMDAVWTATAGSEGAQIVARGPVGTGVPWPVEPIEGDVIRIHVPGTVWAAWMDARVERDAQGSVTGLLVHGARTKEVRYSRTP